MSINTKMLIRVQSGLIGLLLLSLLFLGGDLKQAREMALKQSNYCISYTSDITTSSKLELIREQDAHQRDIDKANATIEDLVYRYNKLVDKYNKGTGGYNYDPLNQYSLLVKRTIP